MSDPQVLPIPLLPQVRCSALTVAPGPGHSPPAQHHSTTAGVGNDTCQALPITSPPASAPQACPSSNKVVVSRRCLQPIPVAFVPAARQDARLSDVC